MFPNMLRLVQQILTAVRWWQNKDRKVVENRLWCIFIQPRDTRWTILLSSVATDGVVAPLSCRLPEPEAASLLEVLLVILSCPVEPLGRKDLCHYLPVQKLLLLLQGFSRRLFLLRGVVIDPWPILGSNIIALRASMPSETYSCQTYSKISFDLSLSNCPETSSNAIFK